MRKVVRRAMVARESVTSVMAAVLLEVRAVEVMVMGAMAAVMAAEVMAVGVTVAVMAAVVVVVVVAAPECRGSIQRSRSSPMDWRLENTCSVCRHT